METRDGKIWRETEVVMDLVKASLQGPVIVDLKNEGPCCQTVGLDNLLDLITEKFGFDKNSYTIVTNNQLASSKYKELRKSFVELEFVKQKAKQIQPAPSTLKKRFGMFVSRSNWLRLAIASYLYKNYQDHAYLTYHYDPKVDYHIPNFGLEDFLNKHWNEIDQVTEFCKNLPIRNSCFTYPILWNDEALQLDWYYSNLFCDIVCETYYSGNVFFMTEKTMRSIIFRRPFLVQGPQWYLKNLKLLGFQTFDRWWDEGYDEDPWDYKYIALKKNIDFIAQQDQCTIKRWYNEMQSVLNHNYDVLINLTHQKITATKFYEHQ